jgi:hypothetical protein
MANIDARIERAIEEIAGNEALLEMLETDAAMEMLTWGKSLTTSIVQKTEGLDDITADTAMVPRLKAVRQLMRLVGNWAAGKYVDPASRVPLRDKLLDYARLVLGEEAALPSADQIDALLGEVDGKQNTPQQLIVKFRELLTIPDSGDSDNARTT